MRISIIGTGYVGLVSGVCLAAVGHDVICVDSRKDVVERINRSEATIYEPQLSEYLRQVIAEGRFLATTDLEYAVKNSAASIITVGTPYKEDGIDLSCIETAARELGRLIGEKEAYHIVCIKSTVTPTTTDTFVKEILEAESGKKAGEFGLVMNPEFLREGEAVNDFMNPDRIVIGAYDEKSFESFKSIYEEGFDAPIIKVSLRTAEMIKYTSNALLALLISYSNEIAAISESIGHMDVEEVLNAVSFDKRLSPRLDGKLLRPDIIKYLKAGRGFGGSCFPKDLKALTAFSERKGCSPKLLKAIIEINEKQVKNIAVRIEEELGGIKGRKILVLGLAFKQCSDDIRESQAIKLVRLLVERNAVVSCADPMALENARKELGDTAGICYLEDYRKEMACFDAIVLMTAWQEYVEMLNECPSELVGKALLFDGCRALRKNKITGSGIKYMGIGLS